MIERIMAAVDVGWGFFAFGPAAGEGLPHGGPFGARRADDVFHPVLVEDFDKNIASIHDALDHLVLSLSAVCHTAPMSARSLAA